MSEKVEVYKYEVHSYTRKILHWPYCSKCGNLMMKNDFSRWVVKVGCNAYLHPDYNRQRGITNPFK